MMPDAQRDRVLLAMGRGDRGIGPSGVGRTKTWYPDRLLSRATGLTREQVGQYLRDLQGQGLVQIHPEDQRWAKLTPQGTVARKYLRCHYRRQERLGRMRNEL